jgi:membrane-bound inhibitor of C-type lysozyme
MSQTISRILVACGLALAAASLSAAPSTPAADSAKPVKAKAKPKAKPKAAPRPVVQAAPEEPEPDITDTATTEYNCELGNKITIYHNDKDQEHIALRWKQRLHRLVRVGTSTGAMRFENLTIGLVWIGIPSKGMLLDSRLNRQLANECKNAEQEKPAVVETPEAQNS